MTGRNVNPVFLPVAAMLLLLSACGLKDFGTPYAGAETGPGTESQETPPEKNDTVYITHVEYPDGYDWMKDPDYGSVTCSLFVSKEGKRIIEIPVGHEYETASDPDMHRVFAGHLYTDYSSESETVLKKDGQKLFSYSEREMIVSLHVKDGDVYTVGMPRSGSPGFSYRKNGEIIVRKDKGKLLSALHEDGDCLYLAYTEGGSDAADAGHFILSEDGKEKTVRCADPESVLAARMSDGQLCYLCGGSIVFDNGKKHDIGLAGDAVIKGCSILDTDSGPAAVVSFFSSGQDGYAVWREGEEPVFSAGHPSSVCVSGNDIYCVLGSGYGLSVHSNGMPVFSRSGNIRMPGHAPAAVSRGRLYVLFYDRDRENRPFMSVGEDVKEYGFNGYFSGISVW